MTLPRDLSGRDLARLLEPTEQGGGHHITIPDHDALRVGTLAAILDEVAKHFGIDRSELVKRLIG